MNTDNQIEEKIRAVRFQTSEALDQRVMREIAADHLEHSDPRRAGTAAKLPDGPRDQARFCAAWKSRVSAALHAVSGLLLLRRRGKNSERFFDTSVPLPTKTAAGLLSMLGLLIAIALLLLSDSNPVLAEAIKRALEAQSVSFVQTVKSQNQPELQIAGYLRGAKARLELSNGIVEVEDHHAQKALILDMRNREAAWYPLPQDTADLTLYRRNPMQWLQQVNPSDAKSLGQEIVRGRETEVFLGNQTGLFSTSAKRHHYGFPTHLMTKVWIDLKTGFPLRIEIRDPNNTRAGNVVAFAQMKWNQSFDPALFSVQVPDEFTIIPIESFRLRLPTHMNQNSNPASR